MKEKTEPPSTSRSSEVKKVLTASAGKTFSEFSYEEKYMTRYLDSLKSFANVTN